MADRYPLVIDGTGYGHQELGPSATDTLVAEKLKATSVFNPPMGSTFPTSPSDGQMWYDNSSGERILYVYDSSRSKWLSTSEFTLGWGHDSGDGELLRAYGINTPGTGSGVLLPHDCTIVRITAQQRNGPAIKRVDILKNGTSTFNFNISSDSYKNNTANINFAEDDEIWVEIASAGTAAQDVTVILWLAWRGA